MTLLHTTRHTDNYETLELLAEWWTPTHPQPLACATGVKVLAFMTAEIQREAAGGGVFNYTVPAESLQVRLREEEDRGRRSILDVLCAILSDGSNT